jgi:hypothetical protein
MGTVCSMYPDKVGCGVELCDPSHTSLNPTLDRATVQRGGVWQRIEILENICLSINYLEIYLNTSPARFLEKNEVQNQAYYNRVTSERLARASAMARVILLMNHRPPDKVKSLSQTPRQKRRQGDW